MAVTVRRLSDRRRTWRSQSLGHAHWTVTIRLHESRSTQACEHLFLTAQPHAHVRLGLGGENVCSHVSASSSPRPMICDRAVPGPLARLRAARVVHVVVLAATEAEVIHARGRRLLGAIGLELPLLDPPTVRQDVLATISKTR